MKYSIVKRLLLIVFGVVCCINGFAEEYGYNKTACDIRYFVTSGTVRVHSACSERARTVRTINAGDYVYVDKDTLYYQNDDAWVQVSGADEYVLANRLTVTDNPKYQAKANRSLLASKKNILALDAFDGPMWLLITMLTVWVLASLAFCILFFRADQALSNPLLNMDLKWFPRLKNAGEMNPKEYGDGYTKNIFFTRSPYLFFLSIAVIILLTFVTTILLFIVIGSLVWLCTWIGRVLLVSLFWILLIGLYVVAAGMLLNTIFGREHRWTIALSWVPLLLAIGLGNIREDVNSWGEAMVYWGDAVFSTFNVYSFAAYLVQTYWLTTLIIAISPLVLFLCLVLIFMLYAGCLRLYENSKMKRYNVSHPCPYCGEPSEPAVYYSDSVPLHVPLRPGIWGMYHITHPVTREKMPTLFLHGKDQLERRCAHCDCLISANIGAEKHVALAGVPASGKSTLVYRMVSELSRKQIGSVGVCKLTDTMGDVESAAKSFLETIEGGKQMEYFPDKTPEGRHKSIQFLAVNPTGALPYRLYLNDIAGEMFTAGNNQYEDAPFFRNTDVLIFALDPFTMKADELDFSPEFAEWYKANVGDKTEVIGKVDLHEAFSMLITTIKKYQNEKKMAKIKLMMTYVKIDTGYLNTLGNQSFDGEALRQFAIQDMGMEGLISYLESQGFTISYHALSASDNAEKSGITPFIDEMLNNVGISYQDISPLQLRKRKTEQESRQSRAIEHDYRTTVGSVLNKGGSWIIVATFILVILSIWGVTGFTSKIHDRNYANTVQLVQAISQKPASYDEVMDVIRTNVAEKSMSQEQKDALTQVYVKADRDKRIHISKLRSVLYANFEAKAGRKSTAEIALQYNALDVEQMQRYFDEFKALAPQDAQYLKYRKLFDELLTKYNVSVQ